MKFKLDENLGRASAEIRPPRTEQIAFHLHKDDREGLRSLARYIRDRLWHPTQRFRDLEGGRIEMTLRVAHTLEPAAVREALRRDAEALARKLAPRRVPPVSISLSEGGALLKRAAKPQS